MNAFLKLQETIISFFFFFNFCNIILPQKFWIKMLLIFLKLKKLFCYMFLRFQKPLQDKVSAYYKIFQKTSPTSLYNEPSTFKTYFDWWKFDKKNSSVVV